MRDIVIAYDTDTPVADIRQMTHYAARFNRDNTDSRVRFRGYTSAGLSAAALIAKDISAGNAPDIILFSDVMPYTMFSGSDTLAGSLSVHRRRPGAWTGGFHPGGCRALFGQREALRADAQLFAADADNARGFRHRSGSVGGAVYRYSRKQRRCADGAFT